MPDLALAAAGVIVFALTTWASLAFGYQAFQNMYETEQAEGVTPAGLPTDDRAIPVLAADDTAGEEPRPS